MKSGFKFKKDVLEMKFGKAVFAVIYFFLLTISIIPASADDNDNILRLGLHVSGIGKLDPHFAAGSQDRAAADLIFNGLLRYVPGNAPRLEPDLALAIPEFSIKGTRQVWHIQLKEGVMFHPGPETQSYELTADDVVFSFNKSRSKDTCAYAGNYDGMQIRKTGRHAVDIIVDKPVSPALFLPKISNYSGGFIVSQKAIEKMGYDAFKNHPVGTGPFKFAAYEPDKVLKLAAHKDYFRGRPKLSGVQIWFIPDAADRLNALIDKRLDVISGSGKKGWLDSIRKMGRFAVDIHGVGESAMLHFNTAQKPFDNPEVRKAVAYAIDRNAFLSVSQPELSGPVFSPVPDLFLPGGLSRNDVATLQIEYAADLDRARGILAREGYPDGFTLDLVASEKRSFQSYYKILKEQLEQINVICNIRTVTHKKMHEEIRKHPKPMVIYAAWRPNADAYLTRFFHSDSTILTGKKPDTNFSHYSRIDDLIEAARIETDPDTQARLWVQAQIKILSDMAALPLVYTRQMFVRQPWVDYGHTPVATMALYPQFTEKTTKFSH